MRYALFVGCVVAFLVTAGYALKAKSILDLLSNWTARTYGEASTPFRMQKSFFDSSLYVAGFRIVSAIVAIAMLGAIIYLIVGGDKSR